MMSSGSGGGTKKARPEAASDLEQIACLRSYIRSGCCPGVDPDGRAVRAALEGLDKERKKIERDEKLRKKFVSALAEEDSGKRVGEYQEATAAAVVVVGGGGRKGVSGNGSGGGGGNDALDDADYQDLMEDWQDVAAAEAAVNSPVICGGHGNGHGDGDHQDDALASSGIVLGHADAAAEGKETAATTAASSSSPSHPPPPHNIHPPPEEDSALGKELGSRAISSIASSGILVRDPLSAVALAAHAALVSDILGFRCTGIPPDTNGGGGGGGGGGGFAAPIRELPKSKFVPDGWDSKARDIGNERLILRYRKDGVGSTVLRVRLCRDGDAAAARTTVMPSATVSLTFGPSGEEPDPLVFLLDRHVNLDGLSAALSRPEGKKDGASPALHYKALGRMLSDMAAAFDLGPLADSAAAATASAATAAAATAVVSGRTTMATDTFSCGVAPTPSPLQTNTTMDRRALVTVGEGAMRDAHIEHVDPERSHWPRGNGDFAGDLAPGGIVDPGFGSILRPGNDVPPRMGGNLMGPNHPAFRGGGVGPDRYLGGGGDDDDDNLFPGGGGLPRLGGLGMQPRFDLYYPPGVSPPHGGGGVPGRGGRGMGGRGRGRGGRGRFPPSGGDPNPDHQRPPSDLGDNMFM